MVPTYIMWLISEHLSIEDYLAVELALLFVNTLYTFIISNPLPLNAPRFIRHEDLDIILVEVIYNSIYILDY
jgi:hypothetical protein